MTNHALEISWWLKEPPSAKHLPPSSLMSFTKYCVANGEQIGEAGVRQRVVDDHKMYRCVDGNIPQQCIIQIGSLKLHLHAKWLPLLMVIQLIQAAALQASISASEIKNKNKTLDMLRLMWFYDSLLQQFARDVMEKLKGSEGSPPPEDWMSESMHRCLTRIELQIPHSQASLEKNSGMLNKAYHQHRNHFKFGERNHTCFMHVCHSSYLYI
jgi:hypothetical protein